jgi:hypothetical protein
MCRQWQQQQQQQQQQQTNMQVRLCVEHVWFVRWGDKNSELVRTGCHEAKLQVSNHSNKQGHCGAWRFVGL